MCLGVSVPLLSFLSGLTVSLVAEQAEMLVLTTRASAIFFNKGLDTFMGMTK